MGIGTNLADAAVKGGKVIANNLDAIGGLVMGGAAAAMIAGATKNPAFIDKAKYQNSDLMFPNDLVSEYSSEARQFYITFQFMEYQRRSIFNQPFLNAQGGIRLPIPNQLVDTTSVEYGQESTGAEAGAGIEQGLKGRNTLGGSTDAKGVLSDIAKGGVGAAAGKALQSTMDAANKAGPANQGLQIMGLAQNPFLTMLFKAPKFKQHQFSWKLTPNNQQESNTIRDIILTFKSNMLPAMAPSAGGTLLKYPNMVIISLSPNQDYLYKFKPCVIESLSVNYASAGTPSFFKRTDAPTDVTISITLLEIEYWLKEDIEDPGGGARMAASEILGINL